MTFWFIDAIDPRGGLAMATRREADLLQIRALAEGPSIFVTAPTFVPELIASRATGFAMARVNGQLGLSDAEGEIPFESPAAVAEFVRRVYLRGSGGDGPGESGGAPPPLPPETGEPPPTLPPLGEAPLSGTVRPGPSRADPTYALLAFATAADDLSKGLHRGQSSMPPPLPDLDTSTPIASQRLARGAMRVAIELLHRRPRPPSPGDLEWVRAADLLTFIIVRMGLWPLVFADLALIRQPEQGRLREMFTQLELLPWGLPPGSFWPWHMAYPCSAVRDPFADLVLLPVPRDAADFATEDARSLQAVLTTATATPAERLVRNASAEARAELALFAAAWLTLGSDSISPFAEEGILRQFTSQLAGRALAWLGDNLPHFVYAIEVESLISSASEIPA